ncbi:MAG: HEAT repeat domain-containing protein [Acidobacteria bacterium]|nr:HEAT repeat domain-containing protein [Acidobacteriota bacterium]
MPWLSPEGTLELLLWCTVGMGLLVCALALFGALFQLRRDRLHRRRIQLHQAWEPLVANLLFEEQADLSSLEHLVGWERELFRLFLMRTKESLAGDEGRRLDIFYRGLGLDGDLHQRLHARSARQRALAALEVDAFLVEERYPDVLLLLNDPVPFVAHAAARTLARTQRLRFAEPVLQWVIAQDAYQQDRLLRLMESFGSLLPAWLEAYLQDVPENPQAWRLFALMVASTRQAESEPRILALLEYPHVEVQAAALRALAALGDPLAYGHVRPFAVAEAWVLRAQAARAMGILGGPTAIPALTDMMGDPIFEVRRNAAHALHDLGRPGLAALEAIVADFHGDRYARDLAMERLEWGEERGHP